MGIKGSAGETTTGSGHMEMVYVIPLTAHSAEILGEGTRRVARRFVDGVTLQELQDMGLKK